MGHDPAEMSLPKTAAKGGPADKIGKYRWQGPTASVDEVHVHDDDNKLRFLWKGGRSFALGWQEFLGTRSHMSPGDTIAFIGDTTSSAKHKAGVLIFEMARDRTLLDTIEEYDPQKAYSYEIRKNDRIEKIDDFVNKKC